ncbi:diguanylate cyclase/phosphodiesterase domain protein, partial [Vibrio parahaemolyticus AQ3810]
ATLRLAHLKTPRSRTIKSPPMI